VVVSIAVSLTVVPERHSQLGNEQELDQLFAFGINRGADFFIRDISTKQHFVVGFA
jgi:hypothetical protein